MRIMTVLSLFCLLAPRALAAPRLVVVVSVDQMRADHFDRYAYTKGLKRLRAEGAFFTDAHHVHLPTETGPGHAVILTGRFPGETGIVGNEWWDRASHRETYCMDDSGHGIGPEHFQSYTLGDLLKAKDPLSKVVGVSLKDRAAILMAGKRADAAYWYDRKQGAFVSSSYYGAVPAWLAGFNAGLRRPGGALAAGTTTLFSIVSRSPDADLMVRDLVGEVLARHELGRDEHTDILAVSFSATDYIGHKWGYEGPEMKAQLLALDGFLADLIAMAERAAGPGGFDLVLTADHAALPLPEGKEGRALKAQRLGWTAFGDKVEELLQALSPAPGRRWLVGNYIPNLYIDRSLAEEKGVDFTSFARQAALRIKSLPGVEHVYVGGEFQAGGPYVEGFKRSYFPGRSGDLLVLAKYGVLFDDYGGGTSHGTPYAYDTHVPVVFWGPDFKQGLYKETVRVADIAPTLAALLGVEFTPSLGSVSRAEILK